MQDHLGEMFEGTIVSFAPHGVYVNVEEPFVDVLVRSESLGRERYELSDNELFLVAPRSGEHIQLGDKMTLEIEEVSLLRRSIYGRRLQLTYSDHDSDEYLTEAEARVLMPQPNPTRKKRRQKVTGVNPETKTVQRQGEKVSSQRSRPNRPSKPGAVGAKANGTSGRTSSGNGRNDATGAKSASSPQRKKPKGKRR
jgi:hypothetical protein